MTLYLSSFSLNRNASIAAIASLINPSDPDAAADARHKLLWTVFGDGNAAQTRDFLWRAEGKDGYIALSAREPVQNDLFTPLRIRSFEPKLVAGDRLEFSLRANATKDKAGNAPGRRVDMVMDRLFPIPKDQRARHRPRIVQEVANDWLGSQGTRMGFSVIEASAEDYSQVTVPRKKGPGQKLGIMDIQGTIEITDPALFLPAMAMGFGRGKAWGCGLMMIRRAA